jgi:hypothetical protein
MPIILTTPLNKENYIMAQYISNYAQSKTAKAVLSGVGGAPKQYVKGGEYAYGTITFADDPTATDTITLNGSWIEFSASATDFGTAGTEADPYILQVTGTLATTLTNLATALNGSADTNLSVATYDGSSGTYLAITYDTLTTDGNAYTLVSSADTVSGATLTGGQAAEAITLDNEHIDVALTDTRDQYFTLASGKPFQRKTIAMSAKGTGNAIITPAAFTDGTTITLDTANDYVELQFIVDAWKVVGTSVATIA